MSEFMVKPRSDDVQQKVVFKYVDSYIPKIHVWVVNGDKKEKVGKTWLGVKYIDALLDVLKEMNPTKEYTLHRRAYSKRLHYDYLFSNPVTEWEIPANKLDELKQRVEELLRERTDERGFKFAKYWLDMLFKRINSALTED